MQIMSSPIMSDAADTPMSDSGGSPSPHSPASTSKHILDFSKKDFGDTKTTSTNGIASKSVEAPSTGSERSVSSSPAILVPTPRSTPPMNGILTPPNDTEVNADGAKQDNPRGRLKFFKDGVLCLELSHHDEGERTKWVKIRSKTVFPTLVHAVKEAIIPCHSTPSSFASPTSLTHTHRVESSTSHSISDDACSMLSSPRTRENTWKQSVPQRGVSACLQFYMKPAPCALKIRGKLKELSRSQEQIGKRWPYNYRGTDIFVKLKNSVQCCCDELSRVLTDSNSSSSSRSANPKSSSCSSTKISSDENENVEMLRGVLDEPNETKSVHPKKTTLHQVIKHLEKVAESQSKLLKETKSFKARDLSDPGKKVVSCKNSLTPKKRLFNEVESKEVGNLRPKKKSPNRTQEKGKTILNIPGLNSEFYKRHVSAATSRSPLDVLDGRGKSISEGIVHKRRNRSPHFGAKSTSPSPSLLGSSVLKPCLTGELVNRYSALPGRNLSRTPADHISPRQEQQYLQQQTVSKAISYTINSLLGTGSMTGESLVNPHTKRSEHGSHKLTKDTLCGHSLPSYPNQRDVSHSPSVRNANSHRPDQDQKSFLRHLLDTSDPIPSSKSAERANKNISRSVPANHNNNNNGKSSVLKSSVKERNPQVHENLPKNSPKGSSASPSSHLAAQALKDTMSEANQSIATNIALSSLMSSFPLGLTPPYDLLARGATSNPHSTDALTAAAAAAAALQYGSLIPGNMFPPVNSTMAAAMASYLGMMPMANFPMSATPTPPTSSHSPPPAPIKSNARRSQEPPAASNHRNSWQGMANGHSPLTSSSPSFRNATATQRNSQITPVRTPSAISTIETPSCGALNLSAKKKSRAEESVDADAPLDLCKKPSR